MVSELLILRHGETVWNREGRMQGRLDSPLTDLGREQARRQGAILRDFGVTGWDWVSSPQDRARETARIAAQGIAQDIPTDPRLAEIDVGDWTGATRDFIQGERPDLFQEDSLSWYDHAPLGEGITMLGHRCQAFLDSRSSPTVVVTHGITSRVLRALLLGLGPEGYGVVTGGQGVVYHLRDGVSTLLE